MTGSLDSIGEDYLRRTVQAIPLGRLGEPVEIARAMLFPASDEAKYITGQTLAVGGGRADFARIGFSSVIIYPGPDTGWW